MDEMGRPSLYKPRFAIDAARAKRLGAYDWEVGEFFSLSPTASEVAAFHLWVLREDRNGVIALRKRKRSETRRDRQSPSQRLRNATAARLWAALNGRSDGALFSRLGYTVDELMDHLEAKFVSGMSWENYGKWHVDHIKPCALFDQSDKAQFDECWSLSNLQPLWAAENISKGAKYGTA